MLVATDKIGALVPLVPHPTAVGVSFLLLCNKGQQTTAYTAPVYQLLVL